MRSYEFVIGAAEAKRRLDHYLVGRLPERVSRAMIQRGIRDGTVLVGRRPAKPHYKLRSGDVVTARFASLPARGRDLPLTPHALPLDIVYEDDALLVVNKPAGLVTHPAPGHWEGTLVNALVWHLQQSRQQTGDQRQETKDHPEQVPGLRSHVSGLMSVLPRAGIVHRLDKDTSGLLLVAKTALAHAALAKQMKARHIRRRYLAVVEGHLPLDGGTINVPIGRHLTHRKQMTVRHLGGRAAVTHYRVLARRKKMPEAPGSRLEAMAQNPEPRVQSEMPYTVVDVSLDTGRTHQIRVHFAHLGHPVIGDTTYGKRPASAWRAHGVSRHLLHAYQLTFRHPATQRLVTFSAPVPDDLRPWMGDAPQ